MNKKIVSKKNVDPPRGSSSSLRDLESNYRTMQRSARSHVKKKAFTNFLRLRTSSAKKLLLSTTRIAGAISALLILTSGYLYLDIRNHISSESVKHQITSITVATKQTPSLIYDRHGNIIKELYSKRQNYLPLSKIPKKFADAAIAIEDKRFYGHNGFDFKALVRASLSWIKNGRATQGASTITQQVVRKYLLTNERKLYRKFHEILLAIELEKKISKEKILEIYLNQFFLGNNTYGVAAAYKRYFQKPLQEASVAEAAFIAGLFQAPSRYNPYKNLKLAINRQRSVIKAMYRNQFITLEEAKVALKSKVTVQPFTPQVENHESYFTDYVEYLAKQTLEMSNIKGKGLRIYSTLDREINDAHQKIIESSESLISSIEKANDFDSASKRIEVGSIVVDVKNGSIVSMIGGRNYKTSKYNRAFQARRAPGSAFKPLIYSQAISMGYKWSDLFFVSPVSFSDNYKPRNLGNDYLTETTLLRSFYRSMNSTSFELAEKIGMDKYLEYVEKFSLESEIKPEFGSIIGQSEVTLIDMAKIYSTFANEGKSISPIGITKIENRSGEIIYESPSVHERAKEILSPLANFLMVEGLRSVLSHGTGFEASNLAYTAGGKTGTTNGSVDNWFCGFTSDYVTITWVGSENFQPLHVGKVQGATVALPIWKNINEFLISLKRPAPFPTPKSAVSLKVHPKYGYQTNSGIKMWFLQNNIPRQRSSSLEMINEKKSAIRGFSR